MKRITEDVIYVQKMDLAQLITKYDMPVPLSIYMKAFGGKNVSIIDNTNGEEFVPFDEPTEIQFFMDAEWILDYDEYNSKSVEELTNIVKQLCNEKVIIADRFDTMSNEERMDNMFMLVEYSLVDYEILSINNLIEAKNKKNNKVVPLVGPNNSNCRIESIIMTDFDEELDGPAVTTSISQSEEVEVNSIKKKILSIFKRKKNQR